MQVSVENCCLLYRWKPQKENGGENMKKYISVVLALVVFFVCAVSAYAISFLDMDITSSTTRSGFSLCRASFIDGTGVVTIIKIMLSIRLISNY